MKTIDEIIKDIVTEANLHLLSGDEFVKSDLGAEAKAAIEAYKDNACEEAFKRGYIAGSIDQVNKKEEK